MMRQVILIFWFCCSTVFGQPINTQSGYVTKFVLYQGNSGNGRPIVELNSGDEIDLGIVGTNLTIVALTDLTKVFGPKPTRAQLRKLPTLRWTYNSTGYIDKYRPYTMVGDYVGIHRYAPSTYLSTTGFKSILVQAYDTTGKNKKVNGTVVDSLKKSIIDKHVLRFRIVNNATEATKAHLSTLFLVRTGVLKDGGDLMVTPLTDGLTYNLTKLFTVRPDDKQLLPLSLKAKFKGPVDATNVTFNFFNGKKYSYEGLRDNDSVTQYLAMEDLMKVGKKTVTVNAFNGKKLLISEVFEFTLTK